MQGSMCVDLFTLQLASAYRILTLDSPHEGNPPVCPPPLTPLGHDSAVHRAQLIHHPRCPVLSIRLSCVT
jgi:hypothetical protein